jgi:CheY-like chemotaxis protein
MVREARMATERDREYLDVLLVEDDRDIREVVAQLLEHSRCRVRTAAHGKEALAQLASGFVPHVILLDLVMPVMNGWAFRAEQLQRPDLAAIPVVLMSGEEGLEAIGHTLQVAAIHPKPIVIPTLLKQLDAFRPPR